MTPFYIVKLVALIILMLPFVAAYYVLKRKRELIAVLPAALFLFLSFLFSTLESVVTAEIYNLTNVFYMLTGIFFLLGMSYIYYKKESKQKINTINKEIRT